MAEYEHACLIYDAKAKGWRGLPRKWGRITGDNAPSVIPFLNFIPDGQYKSLFAGLALIFRAADRMSNRRNLIMDTFREIPTKIYEAEKCCELFPVDESIQHEVMELYIAILVAIMDMMEWLVETGGWKQIKALCQGPRYGRSLEEKTHDIEKQSASVQRCIERLSREAMVRTESKSGQIIELVNDTKAGTSEVQAITQSIKNDTAVSRTAIARIEESLAEMIRKMLETILQEDFRNREREEKRALLQKRQEVLVPTHEKRGMILGSHQLLEILAINNTEIIENLSNMLRLGRVADPSHHNRGNLLIRSPHFQDWLIATSPIFLLVDGKGGSATERISAMTFVSALLAQTLSDAGTSCIHHFCGLHTGRSDDLSGPSGLLRALLAQLVTLYTFRIGFTHYNDYHELQRFDLVRLCALFSELVKDLPEGFILVCVIDGLSFYETSEWADDLRLVLETLNALTRDPEVWAAFKVLVTSAVASRQAINYIPREDHLILPSDAGNGSDGPLTARHFRMQMRRSTECRARSQSLESLRSIFPEDVNDDEGFVDGNFDE
ncbi:hypothetical protein BDR22DRAFT_822230 [Usnea florida]